ncbi:MAG: hypothetical protein AMJ78_03025 [Omnitrophica WOR_2 bacterium SM23_29]|nr:MAG: hypothetical protein AMJ78_03025 [Omnitrophica WOR_2 bacterium SM23_29]
MYRKISKILLFFFLLTFILGCTTVQLKGKEKLEAKDWLRSGDLALKTGDNDTAQYFYELVIKKYPNTYYSRKAKEGLTWVKLRQSRVGKTIQKGRDFAEPVF